MPTRADRHLRNLKLAKDCAELGARIRTIHHLTGLPSREIKRLFFVDHKTIPRGRPPNSPEWYHSANLLYRADASIVTAMYHRLRRGGFTPGEALVAAYRQYQVVCRAPHRISFDRAFDLACHIDGIWIAKSPSFTIVTCPTCASEFLATLGTVAKSEACPFCKVLEQYGTDHRVQASFPSHPLPDARAFRQGAALLRWHHRAQADDEKCPDPPAMPGDTQKD